MTVAVSSRRPTTTIGAIGALTLQLVATALAGPIALPGCPESCGGVQVPYPFGIRRGCFHQGFNLTCDEAQHPAKLLLGEGDGADQVLGISLPDCTVLIQRKISWAQYAAEFNGSWSVPTPDDGPLMVSSARNSFVAFGCNVLAKLIPYNQRHGHLHQRLRRRLRQHTRCLLVLRHWLLPHVHRVARRGPPVVRHPG